MKMLKVILFLVAFVSAECINEWKANFIDSVHGKDYVLVQTKLEKLKIPMYRLESKDTLLNWIAAEYYLDAGGRLLFDDAKASYRKDIKRIWGYDTDGGIKWKSDMVENHRLARELLIKHVSQQKLYISDFNTAHRSFFALANRYYVGILVKHDKLGDFRLKFSTYMDNFRNYRSCPL